MIKNVPNHQPVNHSITSLLLFLLPWNYLNVPWQSKNRDPLGSTSLWATSSLKIRKHYSERLLYVKMLDDISYRIKYVYIYICVCVSVYIYILVCIYIYMYNHLLSSYTLGCLSPSAALLRELIRFSRSRTVATTWNHRSKAHGAAWNVQSELSGQ